MRKTILYFLFTSLTLFLPMNMWANTIFAFPGVSVSDDGSIVVFGRYANPNIKLDTNGYSSAPSWCSEKVKKVVFESDFSYVRPVSTAYWFYGCTNLETIEGLEYLRVDSVQNMDYMFYGCSSLKTLDLSGFDTYKLKSCYNMFSSCSQLQTIYGNSWDILANMTIEEKQDFLSAQSSMNYANYMFYGCTNLVGGNGTAYNIINRDDYNYTHIDNMSGDGYFTKKLSELKAYCVANKDVLTFYYDDNQWERVGHKFDVELSNGEGRYGWNGNTYITKVVIDVSFSNYAIPSCYRLFSSCYELKEIEGLPNLNTQKVTDISYMFQYCCMLENVDISCLNIQNVTNMSHLFDGCYSLQRANLNNLNSVNVTDMTGMFYDCFNLKEIKIEGLKTDKVTSMGSMFAKCEKLTTLDLRSFNTANVRNMYQMFYDCASLSDLDISSFNTEKDTTMVGMFAKCYSLSELNLSHFNTENVKNMRNMFGEEKYGMEFIIAEVVMGVTPTHSIYRSKIYTNAGLPNTSSMVKLDLLSFNTSNVINMGRMFEGCCCLTTLNLSSFDVSNVINTQRMFQGCCNLTNLDISNFNTVNVTNIYGMFANCSKMETIYVETGWNTDKVTDSSNMFSGCTSLVGGDGTVYDDNYTDATKAYAGSGGYLTLKDDDLQRYLDSLGDSEDELTDGVYTRQFRNNEWQSAYLPFALNYSDWAERFDVATINGLNEVDNGTLQTLEATIIKRGTIEANTPFLIRAKAATGDILRINVESFDQQIKRRSIDGVNIQYLIIGNYSKLTGLHSANQYRICDGWLSIPMSDKEVLQPYRWYLTKGDGFDPGDESLFQVRVRIADGNTTAVNSITGKSIFNHKVYDLRGRQIEQNGGCILPKGIYIMNNKKYIVK